MSPKRIRERSETKARHDKVLALVSKCGSLTAVQIIAKLPDISIGTIGHLVKIGNLAAHPTGRRTKNCNHIYAYALADEIPKLDPVEKVPQLWDLWPVKIPMTDEKPRVVFDMESVDITEILR